MPNGLFTPGLITEVAEAVEDYQITAKEFEEIMEVVTSIFSGIMIAGFVGMLTGAIFKGFTKETGIKVEKRAGVPIPIMSRGG